MTPFDLLLLRFLLASLACVAAGVGVWAVAALVQRYLRALSTQRTFWLLGQLTVAATFLVILLPQSERLRIIPPIDIATESEQVNVAAVRPSAPAATAAAGEEATAMPSDRSWLAYGVQAWFALYLVGLAYAIHKLLRAHRVINHLAGTGQPVTELDQHVGFIGTAPGVSVPTVIEVDAPISPMLLGPFRPRLLLPCHLRDWDVMQQQMIIDHELMHLRRRDLQWIAASVFLQTLLWFNPFMRVLRANLSSAQELGCDRDVLHGRPQSHRKAYAAALIAQLKLQHRPENTALAFGGVSAGTLAERIALIREPGSASRGAVGRWVALAGLTLIFMANLSLQPVLAWNTDPAPAALATGELRCTEMADATSGKRLVHEGTCDDAVTPASTFNIAISLMGFDSGILRDESSPVLPFQEGYADWIPAWRAASSPTDWMKNSTVWYSQQITSKLGAARFQGYVESFDYGNQDVAGDPGKDNGLAFSWISSSLKISPVDQVSFLRKVVNRKLPIKAQAYDMTSRLLKVKTLASGWEIYGKTGTAFPVKPNGTDDRTRSYGWFVGWATKGERTIVFARLVQDQKEEEIPAGMRVKEAFLRELPARLESF